MLKPLTEREIENAWKRATSKLFKGKWYTANYVRAIMTITCVELYGDGVRVPNVGEAEGDFVVRKAVNGVDKFRVLDYLYEPSQLDILIQNEEVKDDDIDSRDMNEELILKLYTEVVNDYRRTEPKRAVSTSEYLRCLDKVVALLGLLPDDGVKTSKTSNNEIEIRI